ncbi:N-acetylmuramoyl-L-alanine amidase [Granulosicoccus sp. 3-233]|uniref:N-acetylmuramoyl-L-alanine amidase n=1 Tax=Granulosicoccus sp. 3-233 TaxID=3417969 RepID=UPI003D32B13B
MFSRMVWRLPRSLLVCCVGLALLGNSAILHAGGKLNGFRMVQQENVMLHFDLDSVDASADMFSLSKPDRLVIDLPGTILATQMPDKNFPEGVVKAIRYAQHGEDYLRVVLDLRGKVSPVYRFVPRQGGQRLIVDLGVKSHEQAMPPVYRTAPAAAAAQLRDAVVAIDAGHGGRDPGAIGQRKTLEKDITLAVALKLHDRLKARPGITPVLIRDSDVYVDLRKRMDIARESGADLFLSIHADAINHNDAMGSSVYALSLDGASSEAAAWLAKSENEAAALYGNVDLGDLENRLRQTILSLTQSATMEQSMEAGADVLSELEKIGNVHKPTVEQAAFAVLKAPDIPSILIETAFISNLKEEENLKNPRYQDQLAKAIENGVARYLSKRAPAGTILAAERRRQGS